MNASCPLIAFGAVVGVLEGCPLGSCGGVPTNVLGVDVNSMWDRGTSCTFPLNLLYHNLQVALPILMRDIISYQA